MQVEVAGQRSDRGRGRTVSVQGFVCFDSVAHTHTHSPDDGVRDDGGAGEDVDEGTAVEGWLPVDSVDGGSLRALVWVEEASELELEAWGRGG